MKCSSRRNCNVIQIDIVYEIVRRLNEVQFPKELQQGTRPGKARPSSLNEVQFPKELQPPRHPVASQTPPRLNEVQFPKELQP